MLVTKREKGQTLVEVMIALSILIVALTGTFILIINVVNLAIDAQNRTEAITLAQKGLSEGKMVLRDSCSINEARLALITSSIAGKTLTVTPSVPPAPFNNGSFRKITATVRWTDKGGAARSIDASQIVRADGE